jgi:hypothetical protein
MESGYGMNPYRGPSDPYVVQVHPNSDAMLYMPFESLCSDTYYGCGSPPVPFNVGSGIHYYDLISMTEVPFWDHRTDPAMFSGSPGALGLGVYGSPYFAPPPGFPDEANPPWWWPGGAGVCSFGNRHCWYNFAVDGSTASFSPIHWPTLPMGMFITDPSRAAQNYFPFVPWSHTPVYNPYAPAPPPPPAPPTIWIDGPTGVTKNVDATWSAHIGSGTPPYTIQWTGALSGWGESITGSLPFGQVLYMDVWDATGEEIAAMSIWINAYDPQVCDPACSRPPTSDNISRTSGWPSVRGSNGGPSAPPPPSGKRATATSAPRKSE